MKRGIEQSSAQGSLFELSSQHEELSAAPLDAKIARTAFRAALPNPFADKIDRAVDQGVGSYGDIRRRYDDDDTGVARPTPTSRPVQYRSPHFHPSKQLEHDSHVDPYWNVEPQKLSPEARAKQQEINARGAASVREALRNSRQ